MDEVASLTEELMAEKENREEQDKALRQLKFDMMLQTDIVKESLKSQNEVEQIKNKIEIQLNRFSKNHKKEKIHYEDFAQLFEHGFEARRSMDAIIETSLNEEQLSRLKQDSIHMKSIKEASDG